MIVSRPRAPTQTPDLRDWITAILVPSGDHAGS
jgi:hypothetical protein